MVCGRREVGYSSGLKIVAWLALFLMALLSSILTEGASGFDKIVVATLTVPFLLLVLVATAEVLTTRISFDETTIEQFSIFCKTDRISCDEIEQIGYSDRWSQHVIRDNCGGVVRVSRFMTGAEELLAFAEEYLAGAQEDKNLWVKR